MTPPTLTVLVASIGQRRELFSRLMRGLMPQVDAVSGRVKVIAFWDNGEFDLAAKRQALVEAVDTEYLCFVDDDDEVSDDYVTSILDALETRPDMVGLWMDVRKDGQPHRLAELSLKYDSWFDGPTHYCRDITHENPMRADIAKSVDFRAKDPDDPEDTPWAAKLRGKLRTEVMIDRPIYVYWWVPVQSAWRIRDRIRSTNPHGRPWRPPSVDSPHFSWHPSSPLPEGETMADLLFVVPSRSRPANVARLIGAWGDSGAWGVADLRVDVDRDDQAYQGYMELELPPGVRLVTHRRWQPMVHKVDAAANQESGSYFAVGFMGDDHLPRTVGWAQRYLDELREMGTGIVYGDDGYQHENTPTQWAMTSDIVRALGGRMVPAPVGHLYCDDAVRDLGRAAGCLRYLPDVMVEHMHPSARKAPLDKQYQRVNSSVQYAKDRPAYQRWVRRSLPAHADAVRRLREGAAVAVMED